LKEPKTNTMTIFRKLAISSVLVSQIASSQLVHRQVIQVDEFGDSTSAGVVMTQIGLKQKLILSLAAHDVEFPNEVALTCAGLPASAQGSITVRTDNSLDTHLSFVSLSEYSPTRAFPFSSVLLKFARSEKWKKISWLTWREFGAISTSQRIRIKVGPEIIELDELARKKLKEFHDYLPPSDSTSDNTEPPDVVAVEKEPAIVKRVEPRYPEEALRAGLEGTVYVKMWVDKEGKVRKVVVLKSDAEIFNQPSLDAAMHWVYTPALIPKGGPVSVWVVVPFKFRLSNK